MSIDGPLKLSVQILRGGEPAIGPGKAMVMAAIEQAGSISAAGRALGMSYRRIWLLADALNADWREPVVETRVGAGGGAGLTPFGRGLLAAYRALEDRLRAEAQGDALADLVNLLKP